MATYPSSSASGSAGLSEVSTSGAQPPGAREDSSPATTDSAGGGGERGTTTIVDSVVAKVAGIAAREIPGVHAMGGGAARAIGNVTQRVGLGDDRSQGVSVEVGQREAAADLTLVIEYGESIQQVAEEVRANVVRRIEGICGLRVTEVNIVVNDLHFPGDDEPSAGGPPRVQ
jgi:uncharacterized alkaline shock family protein YloU